MENDTDFHLVSLPVAAGIGDYYIMVLINAHHCPRRTQTLQYKIERHKSMNSCVLPKKVSLI